MMKKKKVLVIPYFFPPNGGAGSIRMTKFVKYLPEFGWDPVVLTPKNPEYIHWDSSLAQEIPNNAAIIRTFSIEPTKWFRSKSFFNNIQNDFPENENDSTPIKLKNRIKDFIKQWIFIPDSRIGWIPFAVIQGIKAIRHHKISVILATGNPWSDLVIGALIKLLTNTPLISDFRDGWTVALSGLKRPLFRIKVEFLLERLVVKQSNKLIFVTEVMKNLFHEKYPFLPSSRTSVIPNGYDEADFSVYRRTFPEKFVITYTGSFNHFQRALPFLKGVREALTRRPDIAKDLQIYFLGTIDYPDLVAVKSLGLNRYVTILPDVPHGKIPFHLSSAYLLLLVLFEGPTSKIYMPCKIFEYLRSGVPILAIVPDHEPTADLIKRTKAGVVVQPKNISLISEKIIEFYDDYKSKELPGIDNKDLIKEFERRYQVSKLASHLNEISG
jgi:glycosyltransferase involved in cell wall biosynthesis